MCYNMEETNDNFFEPEDALPEENAHTVDKMQPNFLFFNELGSLWINLKRIGQIIKAAPMIDS